MTSKSLSQHFTYLFPPPSSEAEAFDLQLCFWLQYMMVITQKISFALPPFPLPVLYDKISWKVFWAARSSFFPILNITRRMLGNLCDGRGSVRGGASRVFLITTVWKNIFMEAVPGIFLLCRKARKRHWFPLKMQYFKHVFLGELCLLCIMYH